MANMAHNIFLAQNSEENLGLLAAQRALYSQAKTYRQIRTIFSVILAIFGPILFYFFTDCRPTITIIGAAWALLSEIFLRRLEAESIKKAATVQEQFDVDLFGLPWNEILVGKKVTSELIHSADRNFTGDRETLKNWYANTSSFPYPLRVLICQRSNIVWDWRLRREYGYFILLCTFALLVGGIIFGIVLNIGLFDYLIGIFIPQFAAIHLGIDVSRNQIALASEKEQKENVVNDLIEKGIENPDSITLTHCREIQNFIYHGRIFGSLVPDLYYDRLKEQYELDMQAVVESYRKRFK